MFYYWKLNLALMTAVAVTCAVITGSLIVGDSVRISLSRLVLDRLGQVDSVLTAKRFVHESLVSRLNINKDFQKHSIVTKPAIPDKAAPIKYPKPTKILNA